MPQSKTARDYGSPIGSVSAPGSALTDETTAGSAASTDSTDASTALASVAPSILLDEVLPPLLLLS